MVSEAWLLLGLCQHSYNEMYISMCWCAQRLKKESIGLFVPLTWPGDIKSFFGCFHDHSSVAMVIGSHDQLSTERTLPWAPQVTCLPNISTCRSTGILRLPWPKWNPGLYFCVFSPWHIPCVGWRYPVHTALPGRTQDSLGFLPFTFDVYSHS